MVKRDVNSRITFGAELRYAMHVRGLSLTEVARHSGVAVATASSAAMGHPVNVTTALRVARAVAARPIIPELLEWVERPPASEIGLRRSEDRPMAPTSIARSVSARGRRKDTTSVGQLRIAVD